jgi:hypothetical protein
MTQRRQEERNAVSSKARRLGLPALLAIGWMGQCAADSIAAQCDIYPKGSDRAEKSIRCVFSQRQGAVTIVRDDGVTYELTPVGDSPGSYRDGQGRPAQRESGLGDAGQIFRLAEKSVLVYWATSKAADPEADNPTAPFSTKDYDATTLLRCKAAGDSDFGSCPAGILRMEKGQASIVIQSQLGKRFTVNFMTDDVNATSGPVDARREGDTWTLTLDNGEVYEVPLAAIEGG